jgi:predicted flap endonuclease-1-like 5' DNA nuclease
VNNSLIIAVVAVLVIAVALLLFLRRGSTPTLAGQPAPTPHHDDSVAAGAATATEDVYGAFLGIEHPDQTGPADDLTRLKGLGPKAAAQLSALGVTRFAQLAMLSDDQVSAVDARMGVFRGRIERDRWVDQARHLAAGDIAGFEAKFGALGS